VSQACRESSATTNCVASESRWTSFPKPNPYY
jgi:hypothetical protein